MRLHREHGTVAVEVAFASIIVIVIMAVVVAVGVLSATIEQSAQAARGSALILARNGDLASAESTARRLAPDQASVTIDASGGTVRVVVASRPRLPHPVARRVTVPVNVTVELPIAPYRSNRG